MYLQMKKKNLNFLVSGCLRKINTILEIVKRYIKNLKKKNISESKIYYTAGGINFFKK